MSSTASMDMIARLEDWKHGHKARSVSIFIDNSYGATCWEVNLYHEHGETIALEASFFSGGLCKGVVCAENPDEDEWAGLEKTIAAAIDAFEAGIWRDAKKKTAQTLQISVIESDLHKVQNEVDELLIAAGKEPKYRNGHK